MDVQTDDYCPIKASRKLRTRGNNGPRRHQLKCFNLLDDKVPQSVIDEIKYITKTYTENDLGGDNYQISQHCDLTEIFQASGEYRQILLQRCTDPDADIVNEHNYSHWADSLPHENIKKYLESKFKKTYRARISIMPPGHELAWHIDTDTSVLCRIQVSVDVNGSVFEFRTKKEEFLYEMKDNQAYFINTGWTHRVTNSGNATRVVLIAGVDYENLPNKENLLL